MESEREVLTLKPMAGDPEVGRWLSAMEVTRDDTLRELSEVPDRALDWKPDGSENTIGTLLYHIALVEADWLLEDILGPEAAPPWPTDLLPFDARDEERRLTQIKGTTKEQHVERLQKVRSLLLEFLRSMRAEEFHRIRTREKFDVSADWVLHHLIQHESEHRAQIASLRDAFRGT
jgi:uncharacterized damage-inducible protein DinB